VRANDTGRLRHSTQTAGCSSPPFSLSPEDLDDTEASGDENERTATDTGQTSRLICDFHSQASGNLNSPRFNLAATKRPRWAFGGNGLTCVLAKTIHDLHALVVMKNLIGVIILAVICLGLAVVLITSKNQAKEEKRVATDKIISLSNEWVQTSSDLIEQRQVNIMLTNDLTSARTDFANLSNKLMDVQTTLTKTESSLQASQSAVAERDQRIAALENQNRELDEKAIDLSAALTNLTSQIGETQRKLDASEGDKAFLEKELKRLMAEKAELERQFNDLAILRAQVAKLKDELSVARRLDWIRKGLFAADEQKGAQKLMQLNNPTTSARTNTYDLNVEVNADGSVKVIPPLTNAPAATPK
jgi:septal ring factor EnvC (AmiA/AmiB activator)